MSSCTCCSVSVPVTLCETSVYLCVRLCLSVYISECMCVCVCSVGRWLATCLCVTHRSTCVSSSSPLDTASKTTRPQSNSVPPRVKVLCPRWLVVELYTSGTDAGSCLTAHIEHWAGTVADLTQLCVDVPNTVCRSVTSSTCSSITSDQFAVQHHISRSASRHILTVCTW